MLACAVAVAVALAGVLHLLYNHSRVNSIPGPFLAALSDLWRLHAQRSPEYGRYLAELHQKYGDVVRLGPTFVSIRDDEEIARVYSGKLREELGRSGPTQLLGCQGDICQQEGAINDDLRNIVGTLRRHRNIDLTASLRFFAEEFLSRFFVSDLPHQITSDTPDARLRSPPLSIIEEQLLRGPASLLKRERLSCYTSGREASVAPFYGSGETRNTAMDYGHDPPLVLSVCIRSIITTFVAAFHLLLNNPTILSTLRREVDNSPRLWNKPTGPLWRDLTGLPYLDAVLKETMRHVLLIDYQGGIQLTTSPLGALHTRIPRGTTVSWHPFVVLCNHSIYGEDVNAFRPERWLLADPQRLASMNDSLLPLNVGITEYPKIESAWLELKKTVVVLLRGFDFRALEMPVDGRPDCLDMSISHPPSVLVRCTPRVPTSGQDYSGYWR